MYARPARDVLKNLAAQGLLAGGCRKGRPKGPALPESYVSVLLPEDPEELRVLKGLNSTYADDVSKGARRVLPEAEAKELVAQPGNSIALGFGRESSGEVRQVAGFVGGNRPASNLDIVLPQHGRLCASAVLFAADTDGSASLARQQYGVT